MRKQLREMCCTAYANSSKLCTGFYDHMPEQMLKGQHDTIARHVPLLARADRYMARRDGFVAHGWQLVISSGDFAFPSPAFAIVITPQVMLSPCRGIVRNNGSGCALHSCDHLLTSPCW